MRRSFIALRGIAADWTEEANTRVTLGALVPGLRRRLDDKVVRWLRRLAGGESHKCVRDPDEMVFIHPS